MKWRSDVAVALSSVSFDDRWRNRWPADEYLTIGLFTVLIDDAPSTLLLPLMARFGWLRVTELPVGRSEIVTQGKLFVRPTRRFEVDLFGDL